MFLDRPRSTKDRSNSKGAIEKYPIENTVCSDFLERMIYEFNKVHDSYLCVMGRICQEF
jgi:hypothetical protein